MGYALQGRLGRAPLAVVIACALSLVWSGQASARFGASPEGVERNRTNTELTVTSLGAGQGLTGFIASSANPFDPVTGGYPASDPATGPGSGWSRLSPGFAGIINARPAGGGDTLAMYCIDILTGTNIGYGYALGTWDEANVPNTGYLARLLARYYPNTDEPPAPSNNARAAAVQGAIWFFSDRFVVSTSDPLHAEVVAIVNDVLRAGPVPAPEPPSLAIDPGSRAGTGDVVGPFTVTTDDPPATVSATGADMFADADATEPIAEGDSVPSGQKIWLRSTLPGTAVLEARARATVPGGNVFLYDGNTQGIDNAQKLILARTGELTTTATATAEFRDSGALRVTKTIAGPAAGSQGRVVIQVLCDDAVDRPQFVIDAGATGDRTRTYRDITVGTRCTVVETVNGAVTGIDVVVRGEHSRATIAAGRTADVRVTDTYSFVQPSTPGTVTPGLLITKTVTGPLAGNQGAATVRVVCNESLLLPDFVIAAGTPSGAVTQRFDVPAGSVCTVTEIVNGSSEQVTTTSSGNGQAVTVAGGSVVPLTVTNQHGRAAVEEASSGFLRVRKTLAGPAAGRQGRIVVHVSCGGPLHAYVFRITARTRARNVSRVFPDLSPGDRCTVTETDTGRTRRVRAVVARRSRTVTIPARGGATVTLRNSFFGRRAVSVTG